MDIKRIPMGPLETNCYIIAAEDGAAAAVDIGGNFFDELLPYLDENRLILKKILLTHGHFDHIAGVCRAEEKTGAEVYIHGLDKECFTDDRLSLAADIGYIPEKRVSEYTVIHDGDIIELGCLRIRVLHTPGHTAGSVCYISGDVIFSGDTLFRESVGRTDFRNSSSEDIMISLKKLSALDGTVYPGHGPQTSMQHERLHNPFMRNIL